MNVKNYKDYVKFEKEIVFFEKDLRGSFYSSQIWRWIFFIEFTAEKNSANQVDFAKMKVKFQHWEINDVVKVLIKDAEEFKTMTKEKFLKRAKRMKLNEIIQDFKNKRYDDEENNIYENIKLDIEDVWNQFEHMREEINRYDINEEEIDCRYAEPCKDYDEAKKNVLDNMLKYDNTVYVLYSNCFADIRIGMNVKYNVHLEMNKIYSHGNKNEYEFSFNIYNEIMGQKNQSFSLFGGKKMLKAILKMDEKMFIEKVNKIVNEITGEKCSDNFKKELLTNEKHLNILKEMFFKVQKNFLEGEKLYDKVYNNVTLAIKGV
jgi:hypothetical protein